MERLFARILSFPMDLLSKISRDNPLIVLLLLVVGLIGKRVACKRGSEQIQVILKRISRRLSCFSSFLRPALFNMDCDPALRSRRRWG